MKVLLSLSLLATVSFACSRSDFGGKRVGLSPVGTVPADKQTGDQSPIVVVNSPLEPAPTPPEGGEPSVITSREPPLVSVPAAPTAVSTPTVVPPSPVPTVITSITAVPTVRPTFSPTPQATATVPATTIGVDSASCDNKTFEGSNVQCTSDRVAVGMGIFHGPSYVDTLNCCNLKLSNGETAKWSGCRDIPAVRGDKSFCAQDEFFAGFRVSAPSPYASICCKLKTPSGFEILWKDRVVPSIPTEGNYIPNGPYQGQPGEFYLKVPTSDSEDVMNNCPSDSIVTGSGDRYSTDSSYDEMRCHTFRIQKP